MRGIVLLLAAGEGARLGAREPKALFDLDGEPLVCKALAAIADATLVDGVIVAAPSGYEKRFESLLPGTPKPVRVVCGGKTRQASAAAALAAVGDTDAVLVHDAARPLTPPALFDACLRELDRHEAVCPALPLTDTIKEIEGDLIVRTHERDKLVAVQTPQGFRTEVYRRAHTRAAEEHFVATDDAALVERLGVHVHVIPGDDRNVKVTTAHDAAIARAILAAGH